VTHQLHFVYKIILAEWEKRELAILDQYHNNKKPNLPFNCQLLVAHLFFTLRKALHSR